MEEFTATQAADEVLPPSETPPQVPGYELEALQGRGSFGEVWSGVQLRSGQKVAVKLFLAADRVHWGYFNAEVERLGQVAEHPNVVSLLDADLSCEPPYFVMNLYPGSLAAWRQEQQAPVDPRPVLVWFEQVARALRHTHQRGLLHCDLKPSNVLLDIEQQAQLADFGQAILKNADSRSLGTQGYMAPEQAEPKAVPDVRWDVYALGATVYFLLTGTRARLPDGALKSGSSYRSNLTERLAPVRSLNRRVDRDLACLVEACLALDPERRPEGMGEILEDLDRRRRGQPLLCRRPWSLPYLAGRALRRHALVSVFAVVLLALLSAGGWVVWEQFQSTLAMLAQQEFRQGWNLENDGESGEALLWWAHAAHLAPDHAGYQNPGRDYPFPLLRVWQHNKLLERLAFSPDGQRLLVGSDDGSARLWEVSSGKELASIPSVPVPPLAQNLRIFLEASLQTVSFAPDGSFVVAARRAPVRWFDPSGQLLRTLGTGTQVQCAASRLLMWEGIHPLGFPGEKPPQQTDVTVWQEGRKLLSAPGAKGARLSQDGRRLVTWKDDTAQAWDVDAGRPVFAVKHKGTVQDASFAPDGRLATASVDRTVAVWSPTGQRVQTITLPEAATICSFSHDGQHLAITGYLGYTGVWSSLTGKPEFVPRRQRWAMLGATFSPDDATLLTWSYYGLARLWEARTGVPRSPSILNTGPLKSACLSPDGQLLATGCSDGTVRLWKMGSTEPRFTHEVALDTGEKHPEGFTTGLVLSADARRLLSYRETDGVCRVWDSATGQAVTPVLQATLQPGHPPLRGNFSGDGRRVAVSGGAPRVYDATTGAPLGPALPPSPSGYFYVALDGPGQRMVTLEVDNRLRLWDVASGKELIPAVLLPVLPLGCTFSPDGRDLAVGSFDDTLRFYDAATGEPRRTLEQTMFLGTLAYSPGGSLLLSGAGDGIARVWNLTSDRPSEAMVHEGAVVGSAFDHSGRYVATLAMDARARLWDTAGLPLARPLPHKAVLTAAFTPDGRSLLTASASRIRTWDAPPTAAESPDLVRLRAEVLTGMTLSGSRGSVGFALRGGWPRLTMDPPAPSLTPLSAAEWLERKEQLGGR